jgi:hypothetical protein
VSAHDPLRLSESLLRRLANLPLSAEGKAALDAALFALAELTHARAMAEQVTAASGVALPAEAHEISARLWVTLVNPGTRRV